MKSVLVGATATPGVARTVLEAKFANFTKSTSTPARAATDHAPVRAVPVAAGRRRSTVAFAMARDCANTTVEGSSAASVNPMGFSKRKFARSLDVLLSGVVLKKNKPRRVSLAARSPNTAISLICKSKHGTQNMPVKWTVLHQRAPTSTSTSTTSNRSSQLLTMTLKVCVAWRTLPTTSHYPPLLTRS